MLQKSQFRPEINGLRGIAVCLVIIFHLENDWLPLGYLGVDVFFVLSGFLITRIILKDIHQNKFSFSDFFTRRIKRILPILFVVLLVTTVLATFIFSSFEYIGFTRSLRYASAQVSNFFFAGNLGYFDVEAQNHALLHTWSLAVEEQFYLVWPFLLLIFSKKKTTLLPLLIVTVIASFTVMLYLNSQESAYGFYMFYSRAWQLGLGAILGASLTQIKLPKKPNEIVAILSLIAVIAPLCSFLYGTDYIVTSQVMICLGVCGIIFTSSHYQTYVKSLLSNKVLLYFGAISYSLYLWHWPVIVFYNYLRDAYFVSQNRLISPSLSFLDVSSILLITWVLSALTYKYVENKYRYSKLSNKKVFAVTLVTIGCFMLASKILKSHADSPFRITPYKENLYLSSLGVHKKISFETETPPEEILIFGDSHALHFNPMIMAWAEQNGLKSKILYKGRTAPIIIDEPQHSLLTRRQASFSHDVRKYVIDHPNIKHVVIAGLHSNYYIDSSYEESLAKTISFLLEHDIKVCIIAQTPPLTSSFLRHLEPTPFMNWLFPKTVSNEELLSFNRKFVETRLQPMRLILESLKKKFPQIYVWHPEKYITSALYKGIPCYNDNTHLNTHGSLYFVPYFDYPLK